MVGDDSFRRKPNPWLIIVGIAAVLLVIGRAIYSLPDDPSDTTAQQTGANTSESTSPTSTKAAPALPESAWSYRREKDDLRGTTSIFASIESENSADFNFPYNGGSKLSMTVRKSHFGNDLIFKISKGQFTCGIEECSGMISFDGEPLHMSLAEPADHSSDVLFANGQAKLIRKLRNAKHIIVELPFYQEGNRQFSFSTPIALDWPPKDQH